MLITSGMILINLRLLFFSENDWLSLRTGRAQPGVRFETILGVLFEKECGLALMKAREKRIGVGKTHTSDIPLDLIFIIGTACHLVLILILLFLLVVI